MLSKTESATCSYPNCYKGAPMEPLALRYFQAVARHEHLSRAADELRVAQPSLSRTIARLESELGVPLFDRHGRRVRLNRFGAALLYRVDRALAELDDARRELAEAVAGARGGVTVAAETLRPLTGMLNSFLAEHPDVELRLFESDVGTMARQLRAGEVDLCFASQPLAGPGLRAVELAREEVLLAVQAGHPLAGHGRVGVAALADEPFIATRPGHWLRVLADRLFASAGLRPRIVCEGNEPTVMVDLISAGLGVGMAPDVARRTETRASISWLRLDTPGCQRTLRLVRREEAYLPAAARRLADLAVERFGGEATGRVDPPYAAG